MKKAIIVSCALSVLSCSEKSSTPPPAAPAHPANSAPVPAPTAQPVTLRGQAIANEGPLNLDEARYQQWVAFRKEMNLAVRKGLAENLQKRAAPKDQSTVQALANANGMGRDIQAMSAEIEGLRKKYGFTDPEEKRMWAAASAVIGARITENPMMASTMEAMKKTAAGAAGPQKDTAVKFLKEQQEREAKSLADAKARYGDQAVATLSAHIAELHQMQMDTVGAAFGPAK